MLSTAIELAKRSLSQTMAGSSEATPTTTPLRAVNNELSKPPAGPSRESRRLASFPSLEHDGTDALNQNPVLQVPADGLREYAALDFPADADHVVDFVLV